MRASRPRSKAAGYGFLFCSEVGWSWWVIPTLRSAVNARRSAAGADDLRLFFRRVEPVLFELLVQGVAVDSQLGRGLDLDVVAGGQHLSKKLALDAVHNFVVQIFAAGTGG